MDVGRFLEGKIGYFWNDFWPWLAFYGSALIILILLSRRLIVWKPKRYRQVKVIFGNCCVFLLILLHVMMGLEFYYRYIFDETDNFFDLKTTKRWYDRHVVYDYANFRDEHFPRDKDPQMPWVAILGDSFVFGYGIKDVNDRVNEQLETRIRNVCGKARVHAIAREGMDTVEEVKFYRDYVAPNAYEGVILGYYINDISGDDVRKNLPWYRGVRALYGRPVLGFLLKHSYAIEHVVLDLALRLDPQPELGDAYYANLHRNPEVWKRHQQRLDDFIAVTRKRVPPIPLMGMIFPVMHMIGPDYPYKDVHRQLLDFLTSRSVPVVDLEPIYSPIGRDKLLVSTRDFHTNELGHSLAAQAVFEKIKEEGWFPSSCPQLSLMR